MVWIVAIVPAPRRMFHPFTTRDVFVFMIVMPALQVAFAFPVVIAITLALFEEGAIMPMR